jgi:hypothetical protein
LIPLKADYGVNRFLFGDENHQPTRRNRSFVVFTVVGFYDQNRWELSGFVVYGSGIKEIFPAITWCFFSSEREYDIQRSEKYAGVTGSFIAQKG